MPSLFEMMLKRLDEKLFFPVYCSLGWMSVVFTGSTR